MKKLEIFLWVFAIASAVCSVVFPKLLSCVILYGIALTALAVVIGWRGLK